MFYLIQYEPRHLEITVKKNVFGLRAKTMIMHRNPSSSYHYRKAEVF